MTKALMHRTGGMLALASGRVRSTDLRLSRRISAGRFQLEWRIAPQALRRSERLLAHRQHRLRKRRAGRRRPVGLLSMGFPAAYAQVRTTRKTVESSLISTIANKRDTGVGVAIGSI